MASGLLGRKGSDRESSFIAALKNKICKEPDEGLFKDSFVFVWLTTWAALASTLFGSAPGAPLPGQERDSIEGGFSGAHLTPTISIYIGYQGQLGRDNYSANGAAGTFSIGF
jgi:hypothetical protein